MKSTRFVGALGALAALVLGPSSAPAEKAAAPHRTVARPAHPARAKAAPIFRDAADRTRWCNQCIAIAEAAARAQKLPAKDVRRLRRMADAIRHPEFFESAAA